MARHVTKPHGLTLNSGDSFTFRDLEGNIQDFGASLIFENYELTQFNILNCELKTPAQQLTWVETPGPDRTLSLKAWAVRWLNEHAPGWGVRPHRPGRHLEHIVFFRTRQDALAFVEEIASHLAGVPPKILSPRANT